MARPNNSAAIAAHVQGLREAKAAFQAMPEAFRDRLFDATFVTCSEIARAAKGHIQTSPSIRTGALLNAIGFTVSQKNGRGKVGVMNVTSSVFVAGKRIKVKGIVTAGKGGSASTSKGASIVRPSQYAHLVEFGTRNMPAEPFMIPAAESQKALYLDRCKRASKDAEKDLAAIGMRHL